MVALPLSSVYALSIPTTPISNIRHSMSPTQSLPDRHFQPNVSVFWTAVKDSAVLENLLWIQANLPFFSCECFIKHKYLIKMSFIGSLYESMRWSLCNIISFHGNDHSSFPPYVSISPPWLVKQLGEISDNSHEFVKCFPVMQLGVDGLNNYRVAILNDGEV